MDDDDLDIDDILAAKKAKPKVKSGAKGKRGERGVCQLFNDRFAELLRSRGWGDFSRGAGSGNRWAQVAFMPRHAEETYGGDITVPENFRFVIESKAGYNGIDLFPMFGGKCREFDEFLEQTSRDAARIEKEPLLIWKKDRKPAIVAVMRKDVPAIDANHMLYNGWLVLSLEAFLKLPDSFFFKDA